MRQWTPVAVRRAVRVARTLALARAAEPWCPALPWPVATDFDGDRAVIRCPRCRGAAQILDAVRWGCATCGGRGTRRELEERVATDWRALERLLSAQEAGS